MRKVCYCSGLCRFYMMILPLVIYSGLFSQVQDRNVVTIAYLDKCGFDEVLAKQQLVLLGDHWGYGYDSLLTDLERWRQNPYVTIDSLGATVQKRALWQLTITSDHPPVVPRRTVFIHARTHPGEVQGWWVTNELINLLLGEDEFAGFMRDQCIFYIIPMYNPDGVELEYPRENANGVDIESNWDKNPLEPEVAVLQNRFAKLMASGAPIEIALNMHSAYACRRYFVYHDAAGTSLDYTRLEQDFIGGVRSYFENGIQPWNYFVSWTNGTPPYYPESWFWINFREMVMALTYEDMNCAAAGAFSETAFALLHGIADYLGLRATVISDRETPATREFSLDQNYPNPFNPATTIEYFIPARSRVYLAIYNAIGEEVAVLVAREQQSGAHRVSFNASPLPSGIYFYRLTARRVTPQYPTGARAALQDTKKMIVLK